jgi:hypothetical protein
MDCRIVANAGLRAGAHLDHAACSYAVAQAGHAFDLGACLTGVNIWCSPRQGQIVVTGGLNAYRAEQTSPSDRYRENVAKRPFPLSQPGAPRITPTLFSIDIVVPNGFEIRCTFSSIFCAISGAGVIGSPNRTAGIGKGHRRGRAGWPAGS